MSISLQIASMTGRRCRKSLRKADGHFAARVMRPMLPALALLLAACAAPNAPQGDETAAPTSPPVEWPVEAAPPPPPPPPPPVIDGPGADESGTDIATAVPEAPPPPARGPAGEREGSFVDFEGGIVTVEDGSDEAASPPAAATDELIWCAIVEEQRTAGDCALLQQVARGAGALKVPDRMQRGAVASVQLAISRTAGSDAPARALQGAPGVEYLFTPAVGRFIEAQLLGDSGLAVSADAATPAVQDLGAGDGGLWIWKVKAEAEGQHTLTLRTRVMSRQPDGSFLPRGAPFTDSKTVTVTVSTGDWFIDHLGLFDRWVKALASPTESLSNLLTLLVTLIGTAGAVLAAVRAFGKGDSDSQ